MVEISDLVDECRQQFEKSLSASTTRRDQDEALFEAIAASLDIWSLAQRNEKRRKALKRVYIDNGVNEPRSGTNPFNQIVRLCIPGRKTNDYYRYALALKYFDKKGWNSEKVISRLRKYGLTNYSDRGRKPSKRTPKEDKNVTLAKSHLSKLEPFAYVECDEVELHPHKDGWVCLLCRLEDVEKDDQLQLLSSVKIEPDLLNRVLKAHATTNRLRFRAVQAKRKKRASAET